MKLRQIFLTREQASGHKTNQNRPKHALRDGTGLSTHPARSQRRKLKWTNADIQAFSAKHRDTPPAQR